MSIVSDLLKSKITLQQAFSEAMTWLGQTETSVVSSISSDPTVKAAVSTFVDDGKAALQIGASWAGTALAGTLSAYADEASTLLQKYATNLIGSAGNPLTAAELTAIQALGDVGKAIVQHETAAIVVAAGGPPPVVAQSKPPTQN